MEAKAQYSSAPVADMDRRVVVDFFFTVADGWLAEISDLYDSQRSIICYHYLREYPVPISAAVSKEKVCSIRHCGSPLFNCG
ncbi:MAG TPA: hypothetical protein VFV08_03815, partial [Puia sp.]|nr:hypothetical protein [Puia sp.]